MTGYYYKVINEDNRRVTVGLNNMLWHYDKDLSGYTLGQGGYYSPQEYISFAVPVTWRQRTENWSWELGGSVSWSHSRTKTMPRYPLLNLIPSDYRADASQLTEQGSSSQGFGYTARALVERRVTGNWFVGAAVDIQQAKDYTRAMRCSTCAIRPPAGRVIWICRHSRWYPTRTGSRIA